MSEETKEKLRIIGKEKGFPRHGMEKARKIRMGQKMSEYNKQKLKEANELRGYKHMHTLEFKKNNKLTHQKAVIQYNLNGEFIKEWDCMTDAAQEMNNKKSARSGIGNCCAGRLKSAYNFIWKFKIENYPLKIEKVIKTNYIN